MAYGIADYVEPVDNFRITSNTGYRKPPKTSTGYGSNAHHGTDYAPPKRGQKVPIKNVSAGVVVDTGKARGYGNYVVVRNNQGQYIQYSHLDSFSVQKGQKVSAGQPIAVMGNTGNSSGVHLDMTVVDANGNTLKRDGSVFTKAPRFITSVANANGGFGGNKAIPQTQEPVQQAQTQSQEQQVADGTNQVQSPTQEVASNNMNVLSNANGGFIFPENAMENSIFGNIAKMGYDGAKEGIFAEAGRAIANLWNTVNSSPLFRTQSPFTEELGQMFDRLEV